ncbi:MAG: amidohydrolase family protein [Roseburia sp.]|nr:amidohydrolase family protein [Roseburia sp.]MCM1279930.1 amidohydrolase family protein [Robinsoniella sp.]
MIIINGNIHTMAGETIKQGYIKIEGKNITEIGHMGELKDIHSKVQKANRNKKSENAGEEDILDVKGAWVMPGIIEAHCHVGITEEKNGTSGDDCNEITNPITPALRGLDAINPMDPEFHAAIKAGITSVMAGPGSANVVGGQFVFMKTHGRCMDDMIVKAPAAMKVAFGENPKRNYGDMGKMPASRMAIASLLREELFRARQYKEKKDNGSLEEEDFNMEPWLPVLNREIPLKAHAHRTDDILTAIRIAKEFQLDMTLDHCTEGHLIAEEIAESGFPAIVGPDLTARSKIEVQNMDFKTSGILSKAGVTVAITTDHPVSILQYLPICAGLAVKKGLPMEEGLKAITINAAKICRVDQRVGSLEPGKDADIAVFTGNPMETFTETLYTIIDGRIVYDYEKDEV